MAIMMTRFLAYSTLFMYLTAGVVVVRVFMPFSTSVEIPTSYLSFFSRTQFRPAAPELMLVPKFNFNDFKDPNKKNFNHRKRFHANFVVKKDVKKFEKLEKVSKQNLEFNDPVIVNQIVTSNALPAKHESLFHNYENALAKKDLKIHTDVVSTKLAVDAEPEFFEYTDVKTNEQKSVNVEKSPLSTQTASVSTNSQTKNRVNKNVDKVEKAVEEVAVDDLLTFDYSKIKEELAQDKVPVTSSVNNQASKANPASPTQSEVTKEATQQEVVDANPKHSTKGLLKTHVEVVGFENTMTIQVSGTDLKNTKAEKGFEIRPQDDLGESFFDYNSGVVKIDQKLARSKMTRSVTILKKGFVPTNTDLILEEGVTEITLPLITEEKINTLNSPFVSRGPIGAVLIELDEETESANLDVPYSKVYTLDENMKVTSDTNFAYQLFVGVKAGNALLSYKRLNEEVASKVIHVHEHELTFETNFYENVENEKIILLEEDLLSREKNPLIISSEEVKHFASEKVAKKINNHTYKTEFNKILLGGRKYLELSHHDEPVYVGYKDATALEIPSENFIRFILSKFENAKLGNRCLVQVNLSKKAVKVDVGPESAGQSLQTYTQILDADGKFYESVGEKSQKIIILGENQGSLEYSLGSRINLKISYQDGTVEYLNSYCSPNSYLVEQL